MRQKTKKPPIPGGPATTVDTRRRCGCQRGGMTRARNQRPFEQSYMPPVEPLRHPCRQRDISTVTNQSVAWQQRFPVNGCFRTASPCRRDSACCNLPFVGSRDVAASSASCSVVSRSARARALPFGAARVVYGTLCSAFPKFKRLYPVGTVVPRRRVSMGRAGVGSFAAVFFLRAPGGAPPLTRLDRERSTHGLDG